MKGFNNGKLFDDRKVEFELGEGLDKDVPRGIEFAMEKMKKGETAQITLKPSYAFGSTGCVSKGENFNFVLPFSCMAINFNK